ncbi:hypothetical protein GX48_04350 [Paracoccidioides brasiliensis]|nr:hypothetical protein GX48_04350 [Paracoccidioides brasiliensis]
MPSKNSLTSSNKRSVPFQQQASPDSSVPPRETPQPEAGPPHLHNTNKASTHKPHRPHVVVSHRPHMHVRNLSLKNINRLQRLAAAHTSSGEGDTQVGPALRHHQHKKSASASPATSPRVSNQNVRWNGSIVSLVGHATNPAIRKNLSTPALRIASGILLKKPHTITKAGAAAAAAAGAGNRAGQKKTVGFELAASDDDDDEWEDNTSSHSPESTRHNSVVANKMSTDNSLNSTLPATKSPLTQVETTDTTDETDETPGHQQTSGRISGSDPGVSREPTALDQDDIASRLLHHPHSSKVPPAISSVSATATPPAAVRTARPPSALPSSHVRNSELSGQWSTVGSSSSINPHGTSSSIEGGVSRFIINGSNANVGATPDSDLNTPLSFHPHYYPNTPPSPETTTSSTRPSSRGRQPEPPSRTQQKLWLQRTAALTTSLPDPSISGPSPTTPSSILEPAFMAATQSRPSNSRARDGRRGMMGTGGVSGINTDNEAKRTRKTYDKYTMEYSVVRRFREPVVESFLRLEKLAGTNGKTNNTPQGQSTGANLVTNNGNISRPPSSSRIIDSDPTVNSQFLSKVPKSTSQLRLRRSEDSGRTGDSDEPGDRFDIENQPQRHNSVAVVLADGNMYEDQIDDDTGGAGGDGQGAYRPSDVELLIRRMWDSREPAVADD